MANSQFFEKMISFFKTTISVVRLCAIFLFLFFFLIAKNHQIFENSFSHLSVHSNISLSKSVVRIRLKYAMCASRMIMDSSQ